MKAEPRYIVRPDPPVAGQGVVIEYTGPSDSVEWKVDGGPTTKVKVPPGTIEIASLPSGGTLWVNDGTGESGGIDVWGIDNP